MHTPGESRYRRGACGLGRNSQLSAAAGWSSGSGLGYRCGMVESLEQNARFYDVIQAVPAGRVVTYGQVAELAGMPRGHRQVARALRFCGPGLPWQRVVGKLNPRWAKVSIGDPDGAAEQRALLEAEGVEFDESGKISLRRFGWLPV